MTRYLLLMLIFSRVTAYAQPYEISVFGFPASDSTRIVKLFNNASNKGTIEIRDSRKNTSFNNFRVVTNAGAIEKKEKYYFIHPENNSELWLKIVKGKKIIGRQKFKVEDPPAPKVDFIISGKTGLSNGFIVNPDEPISFIFHPDTAFARLCPADTNYTASEITVVRNGNVRKSETIDGSFKLNNFGLKPGETIKLELNRYKRINYKGDALLQEASPEDFLILKIR